MLREDIRVTMPPHPMVFDGLDAIRGRSSTTAFATERVRRLAPPADAGQPHADGGELPPRRATPCTARFKLDVLRVEDGAIVEITTFGPDLFPHFGLPETLPAG